MTLDQFKANMREFFLTNPNNTTLDDIILEQVYNDTINQIVLSEIQKLNSGEINNSSFIASFDYTDSNYNETKSTVSTSNMHYIHSIYHKNTKTNLIHVDPQTLALKRQSGAFSKVSYPRYFTQISPTEIEIDKELTSEPTWHVLAITDDKINETIASGLFDSIINSNGKILIQQFLERKVG